MNEVERREYLMSYEMGIDKPGMGDKTGLTSSSFRRGFQNTEPEKEANCYCSKMAWLWLFSREEFLGNYAYLITGEKENEKKKDDTKPNVVDIVEYFVSEDSETDYKGILDAFGDIKAEDCKSQKNESFTILSHKFAQDKVKEKIICDIAGIMQDYVRLLRGNYILASRTFAIKNEEFYTEVLHRFSKNVKEIEKIEIEELMLDDEYSYNKIHIKEVDVLSWFFYVFFYQYYCYNASNQESGWVLDIIEKSQGIVEKETSSIINVMVEKIVQTDIPRKRHIEEPDALKGKVKESVYSLMKKAQSIPQEKKEEQIRILEMMTELLAVYKDILTESVSYMDLMNLEKEEEGLQGNIEKAQSFLSEWLMG